MSTVEKISIALTPDLALLVKNAVDGGFYASTSELIREALRDWKSKQSVNELRNLWLEGITSGSAGELYMQDIKSEARNIYEAKNKKTLI